MLNLINISMALPWFHTTIAGTPLSCLLLLPFSIKRLPNSATLTPHQPQLIELKKELDQAYKAGDKLAEQPVPTQTTQGIRGLGCEYMPMLLMPFVLVPAALRVFFSVKHLCTLPLERFHWSGVSFLLYLTVLDPYYVLNKIHVEGKIV
jgi:YidC/Oxa1 family membrane protein insertase